MQAFARSSRVKSWVAPGVIWVLLMVRPEVVQAEEFSRIDFFQGSLVNSGRVIGLGGAFVSVAEGADGYLANPAAYAQRLAHLSDEWWDWDFALSSVRFLPEDEMDLDRSELPANFRSAQRVYLGLNFYIKRHGFGFFGLNQTDELDEAVAGYPQTRYEQNMAGLGYAYAFMDGDLVLGVSAIGGSAIMRGVDKDGEDHDLGNATIDEGGGLHFGALWAPCGQNIRFGATYRTPITVGQAEEEDPSRARLPNYVGDKVPNELHIPWEVAVGASASVGPGPYNICPSFGVIERRKRKTIVDRRHLLFTGDLVVTGSSPDAMGMRSFLTKTYQASGESVSLSPRFGMESELLHNRLIVRGGTYYEPSRFSHTSGRVHGTGGFDVRVQMIWQWRLGFSFDVAESYRNAGLGLGFWR